MLKQLSTTTSISLVGAVWLLNTLSLLVTHNCSKLHSDATAAFCEVLHLLVLFWFFFCVVFFFNMSAKIKKHD